MKISLVLVIFVFSFSCYANERTMNESEKYIYETIKANVWGGFYSPSDVQQSISDILEDDADEKMLRKAVDIEFSKKNEAEKTWPKITDVDSLKIAFKNLEKRGVLCLHYAGVTNSDGHEDSNEALKDFPKNQFFGYCFYHRQNYEVALKGGGLRIAFDHVKRNASDKAIMKVGILIQEELEKVGLKTQWNKNTSEKIYIPKMNWFHRGVNDDFYH